MKMFTKGFGAFLAGLLVFVSCRRNGEDTTPRCAAPGRVTVDSTCYTGNGLALKASDYGTGALSFDWEIHAVTDTSSTLGWGPQDLVIRPIGSDTYTVPDSIVSKYPKLIVQVATNCEGTLLHSITYGFLKRRSTANNCTSWRPIRM